MIVEPRIKEERCRVHPGYGKSNLLLTLARILEGAWEYAHPVCMLFCRPKEGACLGFLRKYYIIIMNENQTLLLFNRIIVNKKKLMKLAWTKMMVPLIKIDGMVCTTLKMDNRNLRPSLCVVLGD